MITQAIICRMLISSSTNTFMNDYGWDLCLMKARLQDESWSYLCATIHIHLKSSLWCHREDEYIWNRPREWKIGLRVGSKVDLWYGEHRDG